MILDKIKIVNYKSIQNQTIELKNGTTFLFGKNQSGKSNVLRAISLLNNDTNSPKFNFLKDARRANRVGAVTVSHSFFLSKKYQLDLISRVFRKKHYLPNIHSLDLNSIVSHSTIQVSCDKSNVPKKTPHSSFSFKSNDITIPDDYVYLADTFPENGIIKIGNRNYSKPQIFCFDKKSCINFEEIKNFCPKLSYSRINQEFRKFHEYDLEKYKINTIHWKPNLSKDLYKPIPLVEETKEKISEYQSLINLTKLMGIRTNQQFIQRFDNLLNNRKSVPDFCMELSEVITAHIHNIWEDFQGIDAIVKEVNNELCLMFKNQDNGSKCFFFDEQSDGAKRFLNFILDIAINIRKPKETIILLDEPEISLHPSSVKELQKFLIDFSDKKNNLFIIAATHSIFMVDKDELSRNLVVEKKGETTEVKTIKDNQFKNEEVVYKTLGTTIYGMFDEKNFLFEGDDDRKVFRILNKKLIEFNLKHIDFYEYGLCSAKGAPKMNTHIKFFEARKIKCWVIVDDDTEGNKVITFVKDNANEYLNSMISYKELNHGKDKYMLEDLVPNDFFINHCNSYLTSENLPTIGAFNTTESVTSQLIRHLQQNGKNKKNQYKPIVDKIKNAMPETLENHVKNISKADFESTFTDFIKFIEIVDSKLNPSA